MRKVVLMVGLALVAIACATGADMMGEIMDSGVPDAGAQPGDGSSMQYVGNSEAVFSGNSVWVDFSETPPGSSVGSDVQEGRFEYYAACQETFGSGHRMCTGDEIIFTTKLPQLTEGEVAWVDPSVQDCSSQDRTRPAVDHLGRTVSAECASSSNQEDRFRPIACCGPK